MNKSYIGDNLEFMKTLDSNSVDLIYSDILYATGIDFKDYQDLKINTNKLINNIIPQNIYDFYYPRIIEMYRILKSTGSIYFQMDTRINHWIRCIMDDIFGYDNFLNEISWCYTSPSAKSKKFQKKHDVILYYSKTNNYTFNEQRIPLKRKFDINGMFGKLSKEECDELYSKGKRIEDYWLIGTIAIYNTEIVGYATQKPLALMNRIIKSSSNKGDTIADFFCGSGSFIVKGVELDRNCIYCDINPKSIRITDKRINNLCKLQPIKSRNKYFKFK